MLPARAIGAGWLGTAARHSSQCAAAKSSGTPAAKDVPPHDSNSPSELSERARKHLAALRAARRKSLQVLEEGWLPPAARIGPIAKPPPLPPAEQLRKGPESVSRVMYDQLAASRNRLSKRLSESNQKIRALEAALEGRNDSLLEVARTMTRFEAELGTLSQMAQAGKAAVLFAVSREEGAAKLDLLLGRLQVLQKALAEQRQQLDGKVVRRVPVSWYGVAGEVRLMGDFDGWSTGADLGAEELSDSVFAEFTATLNLLPGQYQVKFVVDGQWRLAPGWPTVTDANGDTNNVLVVD